MSLNSLFVYFSFVCHCLGRSKYRKISNYFHDCAMIPFRQSKLALENDLSFISPHFKIALKNSSMKCTANILVTYLETAKKIYNHKRNLNLVVIQIWFKLSRSYLKNPHNRKSRIELILVTMNTFCLTASYKLFSNQMVQNHNS
jgi:hypothetical protein